jgi:TatA/E family protein of Tat protein translocase
MFGSLGLPELLLIFVVALIVFGPRKLPEIGKTLGKALNEFKKASDELKNTIEREVHVEEMKTIATDVKADVKSLTSLTSPPEATVSRAEPAAVNAEGGPAEPTVPPAPVVPATHTPPVEHAE